MQILAKIKSLFELKTKPPTSLIRECVKCAAPLAPSSDDVIKGEHRCECSAMYSVFSGCSDPSRIAALYSGAKSIVANRSVEISLGLNGLAQ